MWEVAQGPIPQVAVPERQFPRMAKRPQRGLSGASLTALRPSLPPDAITARLILRMEGGLYKSCRYFANLESAILVCTYKKEIVYLSSASAR